jgi:DNA-binding MarR family transcriptional regulator
MVLKDLEIKGGELSIFINLKQFLTAYRIYACIDEMGKCTINEIQNKTGVNIKTVYRHIAYLSRKKFIEKDFFCEKKKSRAHFFILTTPRLKKELKSIKKMIENFIFGLN